VLTLATELSTYLSLSNFNQKDMSKLIKYAVKGMIASEKDAIEILTERLSIIAEHRPELCEALIEGVAVAACVKNTAALRKLLDVKSANGIMCYPIMHGDLRQEVCVEYDDENGIHHCATYPLPLDLKELTDVFEIKYM
jgi:hypothetical protein